MSKADVPGVSRATMPGTSFRGMYQVHLNKAASREQNTSETQDPWGTLVQRSLGQFFDREEQASMFQNNDRSI